MKEKFSREYQFREKRALKVVKSTMTIVPIIDMEIFCQTVGWNLLGGYFFLFTPFLILIHLCKSHKQRANMLRILPWKEVGFKVSSLYTSLAANYHVLRFCSFHSADLSLFGVLQISLDLTLSVCFAITFRGILPLVWQLEI